jgi:phosphoribosylformimino-5-aminoimidazole carboxamide ribotide isomerase
MRILPVLDILGGQVVRGVGGRRHEYRPIVSQLTQSHAPVDVARAIHSEYGLSSLYLADLDAISGSPPSLSLYAQLRGAGFQLCVDAGLHFADDAEPLIAVGVEEVVFGLETLQGPAELAAACKRHDHRIVFSLDMRDGEPISNRETWNHGDAFSVAEQAVAAGARRIILLDLARVGVNAGVGTESLCRRIVQTYPEVELIAGGGIRDVNDLRRLQGYGVGGVLLASVLHDRKISRTDVAEFLSIR